MSDEHHRGLERMYRAASTNRILAPELRVDDGVAVVVYPVRKEDFHGGGAAHGSMVFRALDDAAYFAVASGVRDEMLVTASFHLHFLRPAREGHIRATGRLVSRTRQLLVGEAIAVDDRGKELARGSGTFARCGVPLAEVPGYAEG